jgi:hypothetical protein
MLGGWQAFQFLAGRSEDQAFNGSAIWGFIIYSIAQVPVSTPGNSLSYGVETNVGVGYRNTAEGWYAGGSWAVFFPLGALNRPGTLWTETGAEDASVAQMIRIYMGVKF